MINILHVDYNSFYQKIVEDIISDGKFNYISVKSPNEAFKVLENEGIDLIITGLEFKEKFGKDFIKEINDSKFKDTPIVVLSAKEDIKLKSKLFNMGVIDYIEKNDFVNRLKNYINKFKDMDFAHEKLRNINIAVLDDSRLEIEIIKKIFELNGITNVDYYNDPEKLIKSDKEYSLYLVDYVLPKILGEEVILKLRKKYNYALIIAISSVENQKIISKILSNGADDYITKPFNERIFMARLKSNMRTYLLLQKLKEKNIKLQEMVKIDGLTNLYNHKYIFERIKEEIKRAKRYNDELSIVLLDIDDFKNVNDTYGHQVGDNVLVSISNKLKESIRDIDILGRYGGEEFIIILPETDLKGAYNLAERIRKRIEEMEFKEGFNLTISGGVSGLKNNSCLQLINKADKHLYIAKNKGKNKIIYK
ncbi:MAG: diguanylate cyclase [Firmicutes bacterium]|nr:diguanylate cyclase [Bacillota bacterium]